MAQEHQKPVHIALTGGGSAGHVSPNLALIKLLAQDPEGDEVRLSYFGSYKGIEREMIASADPAVDRYIPIASGKLRRYFSWQNFIDPLFIIWGCLQVFWVMLWDRPRVLFSKGGFVAVPVVVAAWVLRVPVLIHESDRTMGLANKICARFAKVVCTAYEETPAPRKQWTGSPLRPELFDGDRARGLEFAGLPGSKPILLVMGGSLGAQGINKVIRDGLTDLTATHSIIHICGADHVDPALEGRPSYRQFGFVGAELPDLFAAADLVVSRAGANTLAELIALKLPHILVPLPTTGSRGDQIDNAALAEQSGTSLVIVEADLTPQSLRLAMNDLNIRRDALLEAMAKRTPPGAAQTIKRLIFGHI